MNHALDADALHALVDLAIESGQGDPSRRALLMDGLPRSFVASLPNHSAPRFQLFSDLSELNRVERLVGLDEPPLAVWLQNAARLLGPLPAADEFRAAALRVRGGAEPEPGPTPLPAAAAAGFDFFIAYPSRERPAATALYNALRGRDYRVFFDQVSLLPGDAWDIVIPEALRTAKVTIVLIAPDAEEAWYHREEVAAAINATRKHGHRVVPVLLPGATTETLPYGLSRIHGLALTKGLDFVVSQLERLKQA